MCHTLCDIITVHHYPLLQISHTGTHVAAIKFGNEAYVQFYLDEHTSLPEVTAAIDAIQHSPENTNTYAALHALRTDVLVPERGDRADAPNMIIVFTDGKSTVNSDSTESEAIKSRDEGSTVFVVGVTTEMDVSELVGMASSPKEDGETYWKLDSLSALQAEDFISSLVTSICLFHRRMLCEYG